MADISGLPISRRGLLLLAALLFASACWDQDPVGVDTSTMEILLVRGSGQAAQPGALLPGPLEVRVRKISTGSGVEGVKVRWEVLDDSGAAVDSPHSLTDPTGLASAKLTLGPEVGTYRVRASVGGMDASPVEFSAEAILTPEFTQVPIGPVPAGDTVLLRGLNFSPNSQQNVATFSQIRGRVLSASSTELRVEVPRCIPTRRVMVQVRVGTLATALAPMEVEGVEPELLLDRGEDLILDASEGFSCIHLPSLPESRYLVVPHSTGTVGGGQYGFTLLGLTRDGLAPASPFPGPAVMPGGPGGPGLVPRGLLDPTAQDRWDQRVRELEGRLLAGPGFPGLPASLGVEGNPSGAPRTPTPGEIRQFHVLNRENGFDRITAEARYVNDRAVVYLDQEVPEGGFTAADLENLAREFEDPIHPIVTGSFGQESDLDANGRIVILLTSAVNRLTEPGSEGFVGGFFFGLDLLPGQEGSNGGEIFYALVPDPVGIEGPPLSRSTVLATIPAIMAHEFEHMIHFNQRILVNGAESQDALWLSEALAQMAEDLVGEAYENALVGQKAYRYRVGNWIRARRYLEDPSRVSVLASLPPGTLAERGAGWLLLKHAAGRPGQNDLLKTLVSSSRTGVESFTHALGRSWGGLMAEWAGSLFLDGTGVPVRPELLVSGIDLRVALADTDGTYPLKTRFFGGHSFSFEAPLWSSAPDYFIISPPTSGGMAVNATGEGGSPPSLPMGLQLLVVRLW